MPSLRAFPLPNIDFIFSLVRPSSVAFKSLLCGVGEGGGRVRGEGEEGGEESESEEEGG